MSTEPVTETRGKGLAVGTLGLPGSVVIGLASPVPVPEDPEVYQRSVDGGLM